ncbi:telomerase [Ramazzottius varieornatus]|uniref:Telomerase reverse transcriptase n=1 Tax=Ramazzottius varieornatus TaxID=947166 RepID=A0A1D1W0H3_RAMVA|nr:telomerase [Ramazzottius varieornatus]
METVTKSKATIPAKQPQVSPDRRLLLETHLYLPHERMLYAVDPPGPLLLRAKDALKAIQLTGEVFPKCFTEIYPKTFLRKAIDGMLAGIVRQVTKLNPRSFLATYAALHSIEEAWKKNGVQLESDVRLVNSKATGTPVGVDGPVASPPVHSKKTRGKQRALSESGQINMLKEYLRKNSSESLEMVHLATSVHDVYAVLRGYCVVALDRDAVFGSRRNEKAFQRILKRYLLLGIADKMHVETLVYSMDKEDFPWLKRAAKHNQDMFVAEFFFWIFSEVVNPLIKRLFYATASQSGKKERCFFRRDLWDIVCLKAEQEYVESKLWHQLSSEPIHDKTLGETSEQSMFLGVRRNMQPVFLTRFIPREVFGVRPIMVREQSELHNGYEYVTKLRIWYAGVLLRYLIQRDRQLRGFGRSTTIEVQQGWMKFRQHRLQTKEQRPLYFVTCDIEKAYDNVHLGILRKLLDMLYHRCKAEELEFFFLYDFGRDATGGRKRMVPGSGPRFRLLSRAEVANFAEKDRYLKPQVLNFERTFKDINFMAKRAVFRSVNRDVWFTFLRGIPQGGPLSSLFLQLYVGALENEMGIPVTEDELMMRYMDDILYISPDQNKVRRFLALILKGYPAAGVTFNPKKTCTNLPLNLPDLPLTPISDQGVTSVSWYGWVFNLTQDLSLKVDMRRYHAFRLRYLASVSYSSAITLRNSLTFCLLGKFAMALFDLHCGPQKSCIENVYEMFVLCAMDLLAYWRTCQKSQRGKREVLRILYQMMYHLARMLTSRQASLQQNGQLNDPLAIETLAWLAFSTVLCLEGRKASPLGKTCRREIEEQAMGMVQKCLVVDAKAYNWIVSLISNSEKRFPVTFRSIPL